MEVYLDNSATTKCCEEAADIVRKALVEDYGNPSSKHRKGIEGESYVRQATEVLAKQMKVKEKEIFFTSGGTESDNWALIGAAMANQRAGRHIISTSIEHEAVLQPLKYLEEKGFEVTYLKVDEFGQISMDELKHVIREDTILVTTIHVNNEVGSVQDIEGIGSYLKREHPSILYHIDAVQSFGKYKIFPKKLGVDMLSVSGHKLHGPKGVGFLYVDERVKIHPIALGGGQQQGMRSGTHNVPGIAGLFTAVQRAYDHFDEKIERLYELKKHFIHEILLLEDVKLHGREGRESAPHIVSVGFLGIRSEVLLHALEDKGIYVSSGSACASNKKNSGSGTLHAMGIGKEWADGTIRFSMSEETTKEEVDYCITVLKELVPQLRRFVRR